MNRILEQQTAALQSMDKKLEIDSLVQKTQLLTMIKQETDLAKDDRERHKDLIELKDISKMMFDELKTHTEIFKKHFGEEEKSSLTTEEKNEEKKQEEEQTFLLRKISDKLSLSFKDGKEGKSNQLGELGTILGLGAGIGVGVIVAKFQAMFLGLKLLAKLVPNGLIDLVKNGVGKLVAGVKAIGEFGSKLFGIISAGVSNIGKTLSFFVNMFDSLGAFDKIKGVFTFISNGFSTIMKVSSPITSTVGKIAEFGGKILSFFQTVAGKLGAFTSIFKATVGVVSKIAYPLLVIMSIWDTVKGFFKGFEEGGLIGGIKGAIKGLFNSLVFGLADMLKGVASWIFKAIGFDSVAKFLDSFSFQDIFGKVVDAIFYIPQKIQDIIMAIPEAIGKVFTAISNIFSKIPDLFKEYVIDPLGNLFNEYIVDPLKKLFAPIADFFTRIKDQLFGFFEDFGIPEIGFTIPIINKKVSIGPFYPFRPETGTQRIASNSKFTDEETTENDVLVKSSSSSNNNIILSGKDARLNKDGSVTYGKDETTVFSEGSKTENDSERHTSSVATFDPSTGKARLSIDGERKEISKRAFRQIKSNAKSGGDAFAVADIVKEDEAYQKLNFFERLKVNVGAAKATDLLAAKESAVAPISPSATMGAAVSGASSANADAAMTKQAAPIIVSAPSTNVSNNTNQNIAVPKPVRTQDPSLTSYLRSPSRAW